MSEFGHSAEWSRPERAPERAPELEPTPPRDVPPEPVLRDLGQTALSRIADSAERPPPQPEERHPDHTALSPVESATERTPDEPTQRAIGHLALSSAETPVESAAEQANDEPTQRALGNTALGRTVSTAELPAPEAPATERPAAESERAERPQGAYESDDPAGSSGTDAGTDQVDDAVLAKRAEGRARIAADEQHYLLGGDAAERVDDWLPQGRNDLDVKTTCAVACVAELGRRMGADRTEDQLLHQVAESGKWRPEHGGGIGIDTQRDLLESVGLHGDVHTGQDVDDLARAVEEGHGVIAHVNSRLVYDHSRNRPGTDDTVELGPEQSAVNHSVTVTGTIRTPDTHELVGFHVNNPTERPGRRLDVSTMLLGWELRGGSMLVAERK